MRIYNTNRSDLEHHIYLREMWRQRFFSPRGKTPKHHGSPLRVCMTEQHSLPTWIIAWFLQILEVFSVKCLQDKNILQRDWNYQRENALNGHQVLRYTIMRYKFLLSQQSVPHHVQYEGDDKYVSLIQRCIFGFLFPSPFASVHCSNPSCLEAFFPSPKTSLLYVELHWQGRKKINK